MKIDFTFDRDFAIINPVKEEEERCMCAIFGNFNFSFPSARTLQVRRVLEETAIVARP